MHIGQHDPVVGHSDFRYSLKTEEIYKFLKNDFFHEDLVKMYIELMGQDERIFLIDGHGVLFYSICFKTAPFAKKPLFNYLPHDVNGDICYIEKVVSSVWNRQIRDAFEEEVIKKYPQLKCAQFHRPSYNKLKTIRRKK